MKKKFLIFGLCLAGSLSFIGCGTNQEATLTNLANQIDLVGNTVTAVSNIERNITNSENNYYQRSKDVVKTHNRYKTAILTKNVMIKDKIKDGNLKLSKENARALSELTKNLSSNARNLEGTKGECNVSIKEINRLSSSNKDSTSQISAKVTKLSNCLDSQSCYYKNLISNLNSIENILGIDDNSFDENFYSIDSSENETNKEKTADSSDNSDKELQNLLYQYLLNNLTNNCPNGNCNNNNCLDGNCNNNCIDGNCYQNNCIDENCNNLHTENNTCVGENCYNNYSGINTISNRYKNGFNPNRNTDSFYPWNRNIDTYRNNGNFYNNYTPVSTENPLNENNEKETQTTENIQQKTDENLIVKPLQMTSKEMKKGEFVKPVATKKGHTQTSSMDINKNIKDLIKGKTKETFNNDYISLR